VSECCLIILLPYILFQKYIYILALEMASPGNRRCANCIRQTFVADTLALVINVHIRRHDDVAQTFSHFRSPSTSLLRSAARRRGTDFLWRSRASLASRAADRRRAQSEHHNARLSPASAPRPIHNPDRRILHAGAASKIAIYSDKSQF